MTLPLNFCPERKICRLNQQEANPIKQRRLQQQPPQWRQQLIHHSRQRAMVAFI
jgi:hypothetical protein